MTVFISKSSFLNPPFVAESAWLRHIPFACWLTEQLKPSLLVELGVHTGVSYFAFCEAVKFNQLNCKCYGVDSWEGDEHAGFYGSEIYQATFEHNKDHYSGFSYLLKTSFNTAAESFSIGSIDLLHIDGFHTYEAVKNDFETWQPKLSGKAVVLFHDISIREKGFGVYKLWEELKSIYPSFEFSFGAGLGVLGVGTAIPETVSALFSLDNSSAQEEVFLAYERLGEAIADRNIIRHLGEQLSKTQHQQTEELKLAEETWQEKYSIQSRQFTAEIKKLQANISDADFAIQELQQTVSSLSKQHESISETANELSRTLDWYQRTYESRSLAGVLKEKLKHFIKKKKEYTLKNLLNSGYVQKKYVTAYLLEQVQNNGIRSSLTACSKLFADKGLGALFNARQLALAEMSRRKQVVIKPSLNYTATVSYETLKTFARGFAYQPKISVIIPVYNTRCDLLTKAITSVQNQVYSNWELCIADDHSTDKAVLQLLKKYESAENIKVISLEENNGIAEASNRAIKASSGDFIALLDHDDELTPDALYWIAKSLNEDSNTDIFYTDECKIDEQGNLSDYFFKPSWSPELMLNMMYTGHLTVYRKNFLLQSAGLLRKAYDFSQDYDLMLRASEKTCNIRHIDKVLYHWRITAGSASQGDKPFARATNLAALRDAMVRRAIPSEIIQLPEANRAKINFQPVLVSLIIPTDSGSNLSDAILNISTNTTWQFYEVVVVTNSVLINLMTEKFSHLENIVFVPFDKAYNFSEKCNTGVAAANGEFIIIYNDDVRVLNGDWIENTIELLHVEGVGGVSPRLVYENNTIQYAGMATGVRNLTGTTFHGYHKDSVDYVNFPQLVRNVSILSGACLAIRKELFLRIGGFDTINTPVAHSDVDLSFKLREHGYRCVYTPYAELLHFGHLSLKTFKQTQKKNRKDKADIYLLKRWPQYTANDPYFTEPMRNYLYHDSPEYYKIYTPEQPVPVSNFTQQDILLVSHDFSLSGAPVMLLQLCKLLLKRGHFVTVVAEQDGPLRKMMTDSGAITIIDSLLLQQHQSFTKFARNFDHVVCNTIITWPVVKQLKNIVNTVWWLHEANAIELFKLEADFVSTLIAAETVITVSDYSAGFISRYNKNLLKIYYGYPDIAKSIIKTNTGNSTPRKIIFSIAGSVEYRKGQDIFISALNYVSKELLSQIEVWFIGRNHDPVYGNVLDEAIKQYDFVRLKGEQNHQETLELIASSDVIVCPSRDDPFPVVIMEAFCLSRACIISSHTGECELIDDGVNGFIFDNEDPLHLAEKISFLLKHKELIQAAGSKARTVYEQYLTLEKFEEKMLHLLPKDKLTEEEQSLVKEYSPAL